MNPTQLNTIQPRSNSARKSCRTRPVPELLLEIAYRLHATKVLVRLNPNR